MLGVWGRPHTERNFCWELTSLLDFFSSTWGALSGNIHKFPQGLSILQVRKFVWPASCYLTLLYFICLIWSASSANCCKRVTRKKGISSCFSLRWRLGGALTRRTPMIQKWHESGKAMKNGKPFQVQPKEPKETNKKQKQKQNKQNVKKQKNRT